MKIDGGIRTRNRGGGLFFSGLVVGPLTETLILEGGKEKPDKGNRAKDPRTDHTFAGAKKAGPNQRHN